LATLQHVSLLQHYINLYLTSIDMQRFTWCGISFIVSWMLTTWSIYSFSTLLKRR